MVEKVGRDRYDRACECAWQTAAGTGGYDQAPEWPDGLADVPHELSDGWYVPDVSLNERLEMGLRLYREMPCYANTMPLKDFYGEFELSERNRMWQAYRDALDSEDDRLADPIAYSLWVDFFEDQQTVDDAWHETTRRDGASWNRRLARVLRVAGPVPWKLKAALFDLLISDVAWHAHLFEAIKGSAFDAYGQIEPEASDWLQRLELGPDIADLAAVRDRLAKA